MSDVILTNQCENCRYGTVIEESKSVIKVYCSNKERRFFWGQYIQCDNFTKKEIV